MTARIHATRWPAQPDGIGWEHGMDFTYLRELCDYWADEYDWSSTERALNGLSNWRAERHPLHLGARRRRRDGLPILLHPRVARGADRVPRG